MSPTKGTGVVRPYRSIQVYIYWMFSLPQPLLYIYMQKVAEECNHIGQHFKVRKDLRFFLKSNTITTPLHFTAVLMKLM